MVRNMIIHGDALEELRKLEDDSVDAIVCDPPSGIAFMGKDWDNFSGKSKTYDSAKAKAEAEEERRGGKTKQPFGYSGHTGKTTPAERENFINFLSSIMAEALRVLKPGGHALVWSLPRTSHWTALALEDAGFEIRDCVYHIFGCLSEDTEILTSEGWVPYHKCVANMHALCYNLNNGTLGWEPIKEVLTYDYDDTAYRIHSDHTDQIVSRNHRCIVERSGIEVFQYAETLQQQESVPILEDLSGVLEALPMPYERQSTKKQNLFEGMQGETYQYKQNGQEDKTGMGGNLPAMQSTLYQLEQGKRTGLLLSQVLRGMESNRSGYTCSASGDSTQRQERMEARKGGSAQATNERSQQPGMEGRRNDLQETRQLYGSSLCEMSPGVSINGTQGRVCDGTSLDSCPGDRTPTIEGRSGTSYQSRSDGQQDRESSTLCEQSGPQTIRASRFTRSDLAEVTPIHYKGVVWCVRVPSGAFVARRNGKVFITGNSGFPKSLNLGDGRGTALKPSVENWWLCRKPLAEKSVAANVLKYGCGALNIDASRIGTDEALGRFNHAKPVEHCVPDSHPNAKAFGRMQQTDKLIDNSTGKGRWPSHLLMSHTLLCTEAQCAEGCPVAALDEQSGISKSVRSARGNLVDHRGDNYGRANGAKIDNSDYVRGHNDQGGASRYFATFRPDVPFVYAAKASRRERNEGCEALPEVDARVVYNQNCKYCPMCERVYKNSMFSCPHCNCGLAIKEVSNPPRANHHPTVKAQQLMRYLVRLITPPGGVVLDCFGGSGSTALACISEGMRYIIIEKELEYIEIIRARVAHAEAKAKMIA